MALVVVEYGSASAPGKFGPVPVREPNPRVTETITSSGASTQGGETAQAGEAVSVTAYDGAVWVIFGNNPTAAVASGSFCLQGVRRDFGPMGVGQKIAVIDHS